MFQALPVVWLRVGMGFWGGCVGWPGGSQGCCADLLCVMGCSYNWALCSLVCHVQGQTGSGLIGIKGCLGFGTGECILVTFGLCYLCDWILFWLCTWSG